MFEELLKQLNTSIGSNGGQQIKLENRWEEVFSKKKDTVIRNWVWDVPGFRRWRVTRMDAGEKLQVLNSVAYPSYLNDQPILGIDLLWFGMKKKLVAVLDFQPLIQDEKYFLKYFNGLKIIQENYLEFNSKKDMHIYDSNLYFSPWMLFFNGDIKDLKFPLSKIFNEFIKEYWYINSCQDYKCSQLSAKEVKRLHINYDRYNAERDPAHGLFKSYFGKEWADDFVQNFLFPNSLKEIK